jgi:putative Mg2+ transporter-C (MgtC) family protein
MMELSLSLQEIGLRLLLSVLLGMLIGIERELTQKAAGLRTHTLVTLGAAVFTMISISNMQAHEILATGNFHMEQDVSRIAASIVSGIGFIGGARSCVLVPPFVVLPLRPVFGWLPVSEC